ncbi:spindle pole body formation-associated protein-domain-containing protein [Boeremia exigua]|uniref:spindle pole body formation-associated protein-domain-containing protein n=1 Tax=Boeremia exigua TaxID=749465 RepID=UPI001E8D3547|nr:spindle pole body formation-associated protein-domain-containing protein [Boeremia exigua]KAH6622446.1 spindle pole body formation-associated protein-domain-containing protein [Boeremia exigua]
MFSWITGPRITNVIEDLQAEPAYESTFIDPPETPAHQFAVKAFKHAIFGTPAPEDLNNATRKFETKAKIASANAKFVEFSAPKNDELAGSPTKRAGGILMTPGTANKGRKTVSFGSQIEDNEGKTNGISRSGIPNNCPGKFPSPWTPGTELKLDPESDKRPRTKLTEALLDARTTTQPKSGQKQKARDDSDITMDLGAPRSDSGKYWKEQYESYAERSEKEMKKVVAKQQLAKKFAMKKDSEVTELATKLEQERKRFRSRERELEQQNKDYQERLRQAMGESTSTSMENAALKQRIATLEKAVATAGTQGKVDFSIYEDSSKEATRTRKETEAATFVPSLNMPPSGKENSSPPKSRRARRQTVPDDATRAAAPLRLGTAKDEASIMLAKSPATHIELTKPSLEPQKSSRPSRTPLSSRRVSPAKENVGPSPSVPSSPLPVPSPEPDPWMNMDESSIPQLDKRAMPTAGSPYVNPSWNPPPKKHRTSKSVSQSTKSELQAIRQKMESADARTEAKTNQPRVEEQPVLDLEARLAALSSKPSKKDGTEKSRSEPSKYSPTDPKFDLAKITSHHAEGSTKVKHDRVEMLPVDRKSEARKRLEERKKLRKAAPV